MPPVVLIVTPRPSYILLRRRFDRAALAGPLAPGFRPRPAPALPVAPPSGRGLAEIRRAHEPVHAEHAQPLLAHDHAVADEAGQPRILLGNGLAALLLVHRALAEHLVDHQRHAAAALAHDQQARALGRLRALAEQEAAEIDHRH